MSRLSSPVTNATEWLKAQQPSSIPPETWPRLQELRDVIDGLVEHEKKGRAAYEQARAEKTAAEETRKSKARRHRWLMNLPDTKDTIVGQLAAKANSLAAERTNPHATRDEARDAHSAAYAEVVADWEADARGRGFEPEDIEYILRSGPRPLPEGAHGTQLPVDKFEVMTRMNRGGR